MPSVKFIMSSFRGHGRFRLLALYSHHKKMNTRLRPAHTRRQHAGGRRQGPSETLLEHGAYLILEMTREISRRLEDELERRK